MQNFTQQQLETIKRDYPEWFELPNGKWYISESGSIAHKTGTKSGYGLDGDGNWWNNDHWDFTPTEWREATEDQVSEMLLNEAKKRGYKEGISVYWEKEDITHRYMTGVMVCVHDKNCTYLRIGYRLFYENGEWATIISDNGMHADIQALKDKYPDYCWTIIAEPNEKK